MPRACSTSPRVPGLRVLDTRNDSREKTKLVAWGTVNRIRASSCRPFVPSPWHSQVRDCPRARHGKGVSGGFVRRLQNPDCQYLDHQERPFREPRRSRKRIPRTIICIFSRVIPLTGLNDSRCSFIDYREVRRRAHPDPGQSQNSELQNADWRGGLLAGRPDFFLVPVFCHWLHAGAESLGASARKRSSQDLPR
jgi:hypothetical protein